MSKAEYIDALVAEVHLGGCKVRHISSPEALEFVYKVTQLKQEGKQPNLERASEILAEEWEIYISRRALSEHTRGNVHVRKSR